MDPKHIEEKLSAEPSKLDRCTSKLNDIGELLRRVSGNKPKPDSTIQSIRHIRSTQVL